MYCLRLQGMAVRFIRNNQGMGISRRMTIVSSLRKKKLHDIESYHVFNILQYMYLFACVYMEFINILKMEMVKFI